MRFEHKPNPKEGETRTKKGFLLFPKRIGNVTKWLIFAEWEEELTIGAEIPEYGIPMPFDYWKAVKWRE